MQIQEGLRKDEMLNTPSSYFASSSMNFDELVDQEVLKVGKVVIQLCRSNFFFGGEFYNKWAQNSPQSHFLEIRIWKLKMHTH